MSKLPYSEPETPGQPAVRAAVFVAVVGQPSHADDLGAVPHFAGRLLGLREVSEVLNQHVYARRGAWRV